MIEEDLRELYVSVARFEERGIALERDIKKMGNNIQEMKRWLKWASGMFIAIATLFVMILSMVTTFY